VCTASTFELARRTDGTIIRGIKLEGEIVPGDAQKLLEFYDAYGFMVSPIFLRSKGGNVEEAMKMGTIIRRLRLETRIPTLFDVGSQPIDFIKIDHQENMICASACFLVYAGGASRFGNYLALHRPSLPREEARKINDAEYEALQKQMLPKVRRPSKIGQSASVRWCWNYPVVRSERRFGSWRTSGNGASPVSVDS
jgi:hypothetical protein